MRRVFAVDYGQVLEKEVEVARLLGAAGVATPAVIAWQRTANPGRVPSWMMVEFVAHQPPDQLSRESERELGANRGSAHPYPTKDVDDIRRESH